MERGENVRADELNGRRRVVALCRRFVKQTQVLLAAWALSGCVGGIVSHSDSRVDELCKKDGGTTIFETLELPTAEYEQLLIGGNLWFPRTYGTSAKLDKPIYVRFFAIKLQSGNPDIYRTELTIVRGLDHKVLATLVTYSREYTPPGGGLHKYECPPHRPDAEFFSQVVKERLR
jgi:hypothetical protein